MRRVNLARLVAAAFVATFWNSAVNAAVCEESGASQPLSIPVRYSAGEAEKQIYDGSYALVVGADKYQKWDPLPAIAKERNDLRNALLAHGFRVRVICDPQAEGPGGLPEVKRFLDEFAKGNNRIIVFLSGHGWVDNEEHGGFFAAVDSPPPNARNEARKKALGSRTVIDLARRSRARHLMFVIDACYSAALFTIKSADRPTRSETAPPSLVDYEEISQPSRQFLTAGTDKQETPSPSIFTPAFILGISGWADLNDDGIVRESELAPWLRQVVANSTGRQTTPRAGYIPDSPREISAGGGEMVFRYGAAMKAGAPQALTGGGEVHLANLFHPAPETASTWPDTKYRVSYLEKSSDGGVVLRALDAAQVPYLTMKAVSGDAQTNGLACHPDTPANVVRAVARALIKEGVRLKIIDQVKKRRQQHRYVVQLLAFARMRDAKYRDITLDDLDRLTGCPDEFHFEARKQGRAS